MLHIAFDIINVVFKACRHVWVKSCYCEGLGFDGREGFHLHTVYRFVLYTRGILCEYPSDTTNKKL